MPPLASWVGEGGGDTRLRERGGQEKGAYPSVSMTPSVNLQRLSGTTNKSTFRRFLYFSVTSPHSLTGAS